MVRAGGDSAKSPDEVVLFNFTTPGADLKGWTESSDTVRQQGMSKATFVLQKAALFQRAVFFALLNPQPNGAGFAGVRHSVQFNLTGFPTIAIKLRGQGTNRGFKIVLQHHGQIGDGSIPSYEQFFTAPSQDFQIVRLPLSEFKPYYRGQLLNGTDPLDASDITSFGIQFYGGVYEEQKQSGPATLEIDWIKAVL